LWANKPASSSKLIDSCEYCRRLWQGRRCEATSISAGRHGSASELEYHLLLAHDLHYLETPKHQALDEQVTEAKRMLTSFIQKLKADR
jgi:four helix bundle protein